MSLTSAGERQAVAVGERLAREGIDLVQTSPRERARQTAGAIAARAGVPLETAHPLDEIDFGDWTGRAFASLDGDTAWEAWNRQRGTARIPGGESMAEAAGRIAAHAEHLAQQRPGARIALVSHADMLRGLVARVLGLSLDNMLRLEIAPASISCVVLGDWGGQVLGLNEIVEAGQG